MSDPPIERFFETYAAHYTAYDAEAITAMCEVPFLVVREGRAIHLGDREDVRRHVSALMDAYRNAGAAQATIAELQITQLGRTSAIATIRWNALSDDGGILRELTTSYQVLRNEPGG